MIITKRSPYRIRQSPHIRTAKSSVRIGSPQNKSEKPPTFDAFLFFFCIWRKCDLLSVDCLLHRKTLSVSCAISFHFLIFASALRGDVIVLAVVAQTPVPHGTGGTFYIRMRLSSSFLYSASDSDCVVRNARPSTSADPQEGKFETGNTIGRFPSHPFPAQDLV